jgi:ketosteroid isomerase-like protein
MKRRNIEVVLGFLDAIRRRDAEAARAFLDPQIVWTGVAPHLVCRSSDEVLGIFFRRSRDPIEIDRLELLGANQGAVFAVHRPESWEVAGVAISGAMFHAVEIEDGKITMIADYADRAEALGAVGLKEADVKDDAAGS